MKSIQRASMVDEQDSMYTERLRGMERGVADALGVVVSVCQVEYDMASSEVSRQRTMS